MGAEPSTHASASFPEELLGDWTAIESKETTVGASAASVIAEMLTTSQHPDRSLKPALTFLAGVGTAGAVLLELAELVDLDYHSWPPLPGLGQAWNRIDRSAVTVALQAAAVGVEHPWIAYPGAGGPDTYPDILPGAFVG